MGHAAHKQAGRKHSRIFRTLFVYISKIEQSIMTLCWICNCREATTGEHMSKRSDLKAVFGDRIALFMHTELRRNLKLQSLNSKNIKFAPSLCLTCNSALTQPHDYAWEKLSNALRSRKNVLKSGDIIRLNRIFPYQTGAEALNVHLYFTKWLGCQIVEQSIPISPGIDTLAHAIRAQRAHAGIWLSFFKSGRDDTVGATKTGAARFQCEEGKLDYLCRVYTVGTVDVRVRFSTVKLKDDWHPRDGNQIVIGAHDAQVSSGS